MILVLACICAILGHILFFIVNRRKLQLTRSWDGPFHLPFMGSAYLILFRNLEQILIVVLDMLENYKTPIMKAWFGPYLLVGVKKPEHIQVILNSNDCLDKSFIYDFLPIQGAFTLPTEAWKLLRKQLNPSFNLKILKNYIPIFNDKSRLMIKQMRRELGKTIEFDMHNYMARCMLDSFYATNLGMQSDIQTVERSEYIEAAERLFDLAIHRTLRPWIHPNVIYNLTSDGKEFKNLTEIFEAPTVKIMKECDMSNRKNVKKLNGYNDDNDDDDVEINRPQSLIEQLLKLDPKIFDEKTIREELITMQFAGTDTTSTTISNLIVLLAMHPEIQEKMVDELRQLYTSKDQPVEYEDLVHLEYMEMVIKESMRIWPIAALYARASRNEVDLGDGNILPNNAEIAISVHSVHHNPEYWANPNVFDPNHFLPEIEAKRHPYAFLPFSLGPRNCIGYRYAWFAMKVIVANLLRSYKFETSLRLDSVTFKISMLTKLCGKYRVRITERKF
uniref:Putative cytochrome n=1 Tax=Corethrella appendiculata TaxID=1370023 RepID=U5EIY8_9DIPT